MYTKDKWCYKETASISIGNEFSQTTGITITTEKESTCNGKIISHIDVKIPKRYTDSELGKLSNNHYYPIDEAKANAKRICCCVNNFDSLYAACKAVKTAVRRNDGMIFREAIDLVDIAIAKVEEEI